MNTSPRRDFGIQRVGSQRGRVQLLQNLQVDEGTAVQQHFLHDVRLVVFGLCTHNRLQVKEVFENDFQTAENLICHTHLKCVE